MVGYQIFLKKWVGSAVKQPYTSPFFPSDSSLFHFGSSQTATLKVFPTSTHTKKLQI